MAAAMWKRILIAGGFAIPATAGIVAGGVRFQPFGLETEASVGGLLWLAGVSLLSLPWCRTQLGQAWPGFPEILDPEVERADKTRLSPYGAGQSFIGRGAVMNRLVNALKDGGPGMGWAQIHGAAGMGKTRMGLEALKALRSRGWDVGVLRPGVTAAMLEKAIFRRRPTALLIDDADFEPHLWAMLDALAARTWRHPLRVILTTVQGLTQHPGLTAPSGERVAGAEIADLKGGVTAARFNRHDAALFLERPETPVARGRGRGGAPLTPERMAAVSGGRVFFMRLLAQHPGADNPWRLLAELADAQLIDAAKTFGPAGPDLLALTALAGPFPLEEATRVLDRPPPPGKLKRFFPKVAELAAMAPPVRPSLLGLEIALRVLAACDPWARERLAALAFELNPTAAARRFAAIDAERPEMLELFRREAEDAFNQEHPPENAGPEIARPNAADTPA